jgi:hypothetical protein
MISTVGTEYQMVILSLTISSTSARGTVVYLRLNANMERADTAARALATLRIDARAARHPEGTCLR